MKPAKLVLYGKLETDERAVGLTVVNRQGFLWKTGRADLATVIIEVPQRVGDSVPGRLTGHQLARFRAPLWSSENSDSGVRLVCRNAT